MADYSYTQNTGNLKKFLGHVQSAGVPGKVTQKYLEQCGYKSANDRSIIRVLKAIGFIDGSGIPTDRWSSYRHKQNAGKVLAQAIHSAYEDLFATYPEAQKRDEEALRNFFSANTTLGSKAISLTVGTFRALCEMADFGKGPSDSSLPPVTPPAAVPIGTIAQAAPTKNGGISVTLNIELSIPATDKAEVYDKFFAAMKKHLFPDD